MMKKRITALLLAVMLLLSLSVPAFAAVANEDEMLLHAKVDGKEVPHGNLGDNVYYVYDPYRNSILTVGSGDMWDFDPVDTDKSDAFISPLVELAKTEPINYAILYRLAGSPEVTGITPFYDTYTIYCSDAVKWAYKNGITKGFGDGTFRPWQQINREQMAVYARALC